MLRTIDKIKKEDSSQSKKAILYCDGASKGNPGHSGIGIVLLINHQKIKISEYIGVTTNNMAEYTALLRGLREAKRNGATTLTIYTDSELITKQIRGHYKVKSSNIEKIYKEVISLLNDFNHYSIEHIPRDLNKEADCLAVSAAEKKRSYKSF